MSGLFNGVCRAAVLGALGGSGYVVAKNIYKDNYKGPQTLSLIADLTICRFVVWNETYQVLTLGCKAWWFHSNRENHHPLKEHADMVLVGAAIGAIGQVALNVIHSIRL